MVDNLSIILFRISNVSFLILVMGRMVDNLSIILFRISNVSFFILVMDLIVLAKKVSTHPSPLTYHLLP